jgi:5-methylcytosine-specific restriction endonuclease McrA
MKTALRQQVYNKYKGFCAYCGKKLKYKDMQVDHIIPKRLQHKIKQKDFWHNGYTLRNIEHIDYIDNLMPACRRCNHYKRGDTLEEYRIKLITLSERLETYIFKVALDYGIVEVKKWNKIFYFEYLLGEESK